MTFSRTIYIYVKGTFGQTEAWDVYNSGTFQHPMVPYDVLVDPLSLPKHPVIEDKHNAHQVIHEDSAQNSDEEEVILIQFLLLEIRTRKLFISQ